MAQLYSIVTPNLTGTKLSLDSLYELALKPRLRKLDWKELEKDVKQNPGSSIVRQS